MSETDVADAILAVTTIADPASSAIDPREDSDLEETVREDEKEVEDEEGTVREGNSEGTTDTSPEGTTDTSPEGTTDTSPEGTTDTSPEGPTMFLASFFPQLLALQRWRAPIHWKDLFFV